MKKGKTTGLELNTNTLLQGWPTNIGATNNMGSLFVACSRLGRGQSVQWLIVRQGAESRSGVGWE